MKPLLIEMLREERDDVRRRNRMREYLQARILQALQDAGAFSGSTVSLNIVGSGSNPGSSSGPPSCDRCQRLASRE